MIVQSSSPVRSVLVNNPNSRPDEIPTLIPVTAWPTTGPFYAFGGGYTSVLELVNGSDTDDAQVTLNAFTSSGVAVNSQPMTVTLAASQRQDFDFGSIFGIGGSNQVSSGYYTVAAQPAVFRLFQATPLIFGVLRIGVGTATSVMPFSPTAGSSLYLNPAAETATTYTGLAILNPLPSASTVTISAFSSNGAALSPVSFNLPANTSSIQLLRNLVPQSLNNDNLLVQITSTGGPVQMISFRGKLDSSELIFLKGETTP